MREKNRNSIEKCIKRLPQFTTMNVIDGQAGLMSYSSLIFYSLTIDNILNIIVLLILAAVSIATLTGENGILIRATDSKTQTKIAEEKEAISLAYSGAVAEKRGTGDIIASDLNREFGTNGTNATATDETDGTMTVTFPDTNRKYIIDENGNIEETESEEIDVPDFDENNLVIGEAINTNKYGWKVTNYNITTNQIPSGVWRLFYQDNNYTYIIADKQYSDRLEEFSENYTNGSDVSTIGKKLNSKISSLLVEENNNKNILYTAYFTDTKNWGIYMNDDAIFAIRYSYGRIICSII